MPGWRYCRYRTAHGQLPVRTKLHRRARSFSRLFARRGLTGFITVIIAVALCGRFCHCRVHADVANARIAQLRHRWKWERIRLRIEPKTRGPIGRFSRARGRFNRWIDSTRRWHRVVYAAVNDSRGLPASGFAGKNDDGPLLHVFPSVRSRTDRVCHVARRKKSILSLFITLDPKAEYVFAFDNFI